jgi:hypothetical protein
MKGKSNYARGIGDRSHNSAAITRIRGNLRLKRLKLTYYYLLKKCTLTPKSYMF